MREAGVVILGLGYFSRFHLAGWNAAPGVRVVAAADLDPVRRSLARRAFAIPVYPDARALLSETRPEIVDIVAPPLAHAELVRAALAPGRIVICQKPFARSLAEASALARAADAAGATLAIHENFRFQPWHRTIRAFLGSGRMGTIWNARFALRPGDGRGPDAYRDRQPAFREMDRLLIHETGVHFADLFRWLFGDITGVYAETRRLNAAIQGEDAALVVFEHAGGTRSMFDGNRLADHAAENLRHTMGEMEIVGEGGTLTLDGTGRVRFRPYGAGECEDIPTVQPVDDASFGGGCAEALIAHVARHRDRPERIENRVRDYLPVIASVEAAYRSVASGRRETPEDTGSNPQGT